jgi:hypothetical protein
VNQKRWVTSGRCRLSIIRWMMTNSFALHRGVVCATFLYTRWLLLSPFLFPLSPSAFKNIIAFSPHLICNRFLLRVLWSFHVPEVDVLTPLDNATSGLYSKQPLETGHCAHKLAWMGFVRLPFRPLVPISRGAELSKTTYWMANK